MCSVNGRLKVDLDTIAYLSTSLFTVIPRNVIRRIEHTLLVHHRDRRSIVLEDNFQNPTLRLTKRYWLSFKSLTSVRSGGVPS